MTKNAENKCWYKIQNILLTSKSHDRHEYLQQIVLDVICLKIYSAIKGTSRYNNDTSTINPYSAVLDSSKDGFFFSILRYLHSNIT